MSDTTLNRFLAQGTNAERLAFTPSPPTPASGPDPGYLFYETDTGDMYAWDDVGSAWVQVTSAGSFTNPMTTDQDLIVGGVAGAPGRLGVGAVGRVLTVGSGGIVDWEAIVVPGGAITASGYTMATARMLGRATAGTGAIEEIAVTGSGSAVLATSPTLVTPALGTPTALVLTNATGLPVASGISGLGSNVAAFLATPSSANLAAAVTDETGTGLLVFGTAPVFASTITVGTAAGTTGAINLVGTTSGVFTMSVNDAAGTWTAKWPATAGSNTNVLTTDGSGNLSWAAAAGSSGTVNSGTATNFAYYPATAAAVSGTGTLAVSSTGRLTMTPTALASSFGAYLTVQAPSDAGMTTGNEAIGVNFLAAATTRAWAGSTGFATQREFSFGIPTYAFASATGTIGDGYTVYIGGAPIAGSNAAITNKWALGINSGNVLFGGDLIFKATLITSGIFNASNLGLLDLRSQGGLNLSPSTSSAGILSIAGSAQDVVLSDSTATRTWQGLSSVIGAGDFVQRSGNVTGGYNTMTVGTTSFGIFNSYCAGGSYGSLTATPSGMGGWQARSYSYGGSTWAISALIKQVFTQTQSETARGSQIVFGTTPNNSTTIAAVMTIDQDATVTTTAGIKTGAPSGGTAAFWKFGVLVTAVVTPDTTRYIQLDVGGTLYKVIVST